MWHSMSFSAAKRVVFRLRIVLPNTIFAQLGCVCFHCFHVFPYFSCFHHVFTSVKRRGVLRVPTFFSPKGVQRYSWMDGLGKVEGAFGAIFSSCFHIFQIGQTSWSSPCLRRFFSPKGVQLHAGWMALERLKVDWEPKGCVGSTVFGCFQPGQGLNVNLKNINEHFKWTAWWVKMSSCWLIFRVYYSCSGYHILWLEICCMKQEIHVKPQ